VEEVETGFPERGDSSVLKMKLKNNKRREKIDHYLEAGDGAGGESYDNKPG